MMSVESQVDHGAPDAAPPYITPNVEPGPKPELKWVPLARLSVDRRYQRELGATNRAHINRIAREFRWGLCQPLCVAKVDGGYTIIDGQHRFEAAKKHPEVEQLPCWVIDAENLADQARAFEALNSARIGVSRLQRFWASLAAGDPMAVRIKGLCDRAGVLIARTAQKDLPPRTLGCTFTLEKLTPLGDAAITTGLKLILEAQGDVETAFRSNVVAALVKIIAEDGKDFDRSRWLTALQSIDFADAEAAARAERAKQGGSVEAAVERRLRRAFERAPGRKAAANG